MAGTSAPALQQSAAICTFDGRDVTAQNVALTALSVTVDGDPPSVGDTLTVRFTLENVGQEPFVFGQTHGAYGVLEREGNQVRFGDGAHGRSLDPGESYTHEATYRFGSGESGPVAVWPGFEDANGQTSPSPWHPCEFTVEPADDTPPSVAVAVEPTPPVNESESVTFVATASDASGVDEVEIALDGVPVTTCAASPCEVEVGRLSAGTHRVVATATDGAGNVGTSNPLEFEVVDAPAAPSPVLVETTHVVASVNGTPHAFIGARATSDAGAIASTTIVLDGEPVATCDGPVCEYDATGEPGSEHAYYATSLDEAGNVGSSLDTGEAASDLGTPVVFDAGAEVARRLPPSVEFTAPTAVDTFDATAEVAFVVSDPDGIDRIEFERNFGADEPVPVCEAGATDCDRTERTYTETVDLDSGLNNFVVWAWDEDGNRGAAVRTIYRIDPESERYRVAIEADPADPEPGEAVTLTATAASIRGADTVTGLRLHRAGFFSREELATCRPDRRTDEVVCEATFEPAPGPRIVSVYAVAEAVGDVEVRSESRTLLFDSGEDTDQDGLTDLGEAMLCTDPDDPDTDRDGLLDGWEVEGLRFPDGHAVDLPRQGADPCAPDVFLEIDWWADDEHTHAPSVRAMTTLLNAYRSGGVTLHADLDEPVPHNLTNASGPYTGPYHYNSGYEYKLRKAQHFDPHRLWTHSYASVRHRTGASSYVFANSVNIMTPDDAPAWYEASELFHELGHALGLGHGGRLGIRAEHTRVRGGDVVTYAGRWDNDNWKPNYLSAMNYAHMDTVYRNTKTGRFVRVNDYSRVALPDLDERHLDERPTSATATALRDYPLPGFWSGESDWEAVVKYGCSAPLPAAPFLSVPAVVISNGTHTVAYRVAGGEWVLDSLTDHPPGIDWNCDGRIEADVRADVDGGSDGLLDRSGRTTTLEGREDWSRIPVRHPCPAQQDTDRTLGGFTLEVAPAPSDAYLERGHDPPCIDYDLGAYDVGHLPLADLDPVPAEWCDRVDNDDDGAVDEGCPDGDDDGWPDPVDNCPTVANADQRDRDDDHVGDACDGPLPAPGGLEAERTEAGVSLSWEAVEGARGYVVHRRLANGSVRYLGPYPSTTTTAFVDEGAPASGEVAYAVRAVNRMTGERGEPAAVAASAGGGLGGLALGAAAVAAVLLLAGVAVAVARRRRGGPPT